jgi:hypothetical protein
MGDIDVVSLLVATAAALVEVKRRVSVAVRLPDLLQALGLV